jgi:hypothetical protein
MREQILWICGRKTTKEFQSTAIPMPVQGNRDDKKHTEKIVIPTATFEPTISEIFQEFVWRK